MRTLIPRSRWGRLAAAAAITTSLVLGGSALARPDGSGKRAGLEKLERKLERLDLDAETRDAAFAVLDRARADRRAFAPELREARDTMRELMSQTEVEEPAVMAQVEAVHALELERHKARLRTMLELRELLTTEQWQELRPQRRGNRGRSD
ncbi:MAG: periplasmic heavy metal sensor [Myxococcota bacterium]